MGSLDVYYLHEHDDNPIVLTAAAEVGALIERVRLESPAEAPILMNVFLSGDPYAQMLDVGVSGSRGLVRYAGREWPAGVVSTNGDPRREGSGVPYFYADQWQEYPSNSEIPVGIVRQAVEEFMESDGARPTCVEWQPDLSA